MTNDQHEAHVQRITQDPVYKVGYLAGLAGASASQCDDVEPDQVAWADGWLNGTSEAVSKGETIAAWTSEGRRKTTGSPSVPVRRRAQR